MDFLALCKQAARDSGTIAGLPQFLTVEDATERVAQLVGWVRDAYIDIQNERPDWLWLRARFQAPLTIDQAEYTPAELNIVRFGAFTGDRPGHRVLSLYDPAEGKKDEGEIVQVPYDYWQRTYDRGEHDANRPTEWALTPQQTIVFGNTPDKAYVVRGEYRKSPQILELDEDVPEMPEQFHRLIIAEAIRLMAESDEAFQVLQSKALQYSRLRNPLVLAQTPEADIWGNGPAA